MKNAVEADKIRNGTSEEIKCKALDMIKGEECWATFCINQGDSEVGIKLANHGIPLGEMVASLCLIVSATPHPGITKDNFISQVMDGIRDLLDKMVENDG